MRSNLRVYFELAKALADHNFKPTWEGICPYGKSNESSHFQLDSDVRDELGLYGFVVAADALAQMIFSPIFGILSDKLGQIRIVSMICAGTFTIGNVMYALASLVPQDLWGIHIPRLWFVLATRFIVGMGTCKTPFVDDNCATGWLVP